MEDGESAERQRSKNRLRNTRKVNFRRRETRANSAKNQGKCRKVSQFYELTNTVRVDLRQVISDMCMLSVNQNTNTEWEVKFVITDSVTNS